MSDYGSRFYRTQIIGAMSTATIASQVDRRNENLITYLYVSSYNSANPTAPYRFNSFNEKIKYNIGQSVAIGGGNIQ